MAISVLSLKSLTNSGGGSSSSKFVGNVTNGGSFPTTRLDGSALQEGDYVRPASNASFPFSVGTCTFNSTRDKAIYSPNGSTWLIDPGALQDTSETPVKNSSTESISGTKTTQAGINAENKTEIEKKVEQSTIDNQQLLYARENGTEKTIKYGAGADLGSGTIPTRVIGGNLQVGTPTADNHAASKQYVDEHSSSDLFKITATFNTGSTTQGTFDKTAEEIRTAYSAGKKLYVVLKTTDDDGIFELVAIVCNESIIKAIFVRSLPYNGDASLEIMNWSDSSGGFEISQKIEATKFQYSTLPTASAELFGKIYQYTGTTGTYTQGHFYVCTDDGAGGYKWAEISGGSGGGYEPDGITTKLNSDNQIATVVGGGEADNLKILYWDTTNPATFFAKEESELDYDMFAWESEFNEVSDEDTVSGKISVDGTQYTFTDVAVEDLPIQGHNDDEIPGIKIPNIFGGTVDTYVFLYDGMIAVKCTDTYSSSTILIGELTINYHETTILQIKGKYIKHDETLITSSSQSELGVQISGQSGNNLEVVEDGLYCSGGSASGSLDNITLKTNEDDEQYAVYGGGEYFQGYNTQTLVDEAITGTYDDSYGIPLELFGYVDSTNWKVGYYVTEVTFKYNGVVKRFEDCEIKKKDFGEEFGEFKVIEVYDVIESGVSSYIGLIGSELTFVSDSTFTSTDTFEMDSLIVQYEEFSKETIDVDYVPYSTKFFKAEDDVFQPKVEFGTWEELRELLHYNGTPTSSFSGGTCELDSAENTAQAGSTINVNYEIYLTDGTRIRPNCSGTLQQTAESEFTAELGESITPDQNVFKSIILKTDTDPYKLVIVLDETLCPESTIDSFDQLVVEQVLYVDTVHTLPNQYIEKSTDSDNALEIRSNGLYVPKTNVDGELSEDSTNPVMNKIITQALNGKQGTLSAGDNITIENNGISSNQIEDANTGTNKTWSASKLTTQFGNKQNTLTAGDNITITNDTISSNQIDDSSTATNKAWSSSKVNTEFGNYQPISDRGVASGYCDLNASCHVPTAYLPSYVDEILEGTYVDATHFKKKDSEEYYDPLTDDVIYVDVDTNKSYRYGGSVLAELSQGVAIGETSSTAYRGDRGKTAYEHSQTTGNPHSTAISDIDGLSDKLYTPDGKTIEADSDKKISTALSAESDNTLQIKDDGLYNPAGSIAVKTLSVETGASAYIEPINTFFAHCYQYGQIVIVNMLIQTKSEEVPSNNCIVTGLPKPAKQCCVSLTKYMSSSTGTADTQTLQLMANSGQLWNNTTLDANAYYNLNFCYYTTQA